MSATLRSFAVALTIPDNEAFTALATLRRMGFAVGDVRRATIWTFEVEPAAAGSLAQTLGSIETICNPNKHELVERYDSRPVPGEVWIAPRHETGRSSVGGRVLAGVHGILRRTAWQLFDERGAIVEPAILDRAVETFLCNSAFEKAIR